MILRANVHDIFSVTPEGWISSFLKFLHIHIDKVCVSNYLHV